MSYHLTPAGMVVIKKTRDSKHWWGCGEKETLVHCWWECKLVQLLCKTVWRFLKKLKLKLLWSSNPTTGHISEGNDIITSKICLYPHAHCSIIYDRQDTKTTEVSSVGEWIKKMWYIYTHTRVYLHTHPYTCIYIYHTYMHTKEYYSATNRRKFCHLWQLDESQGYQGKCNVRQRKTNIVWSHLCVES